MNSERDTKIEVQFRSLEDELATELRQVLPTAAEIGARLFTNSRFNPHGLLQGHLDPRAEKYLRLAEECLSLRERIGHSQEDSVSKRYMEACAEAADLSNEHRLGPRRLAARLLNWLRDANAQ